MKHSLVLSAAIIALSLPFAAIAETPATKPAGKEREYKRPETRAEAIKIAEDKVAELKKMTDAEWQAKQAKRAERREKLKDLTPEQRKALREKMKQKAQ